MLSEGLALEPFPSSARTAVMRRRVCADRSHMKTSERSLPSPGTRRLAAESNATTVASPLILGRALFPLAGEPSNERVINSSAPSLRVEEIDVRQSVRVARHESRARLECHEPAIGAERHADLIRCSVRWQTLSGKNRRFLCDGCRRQERRNEGQGPGRRCGRACHFAPPALSRRAAAETSSVTILPIWSARCVSSTRRRLFSTTPSASGPSQGARCRPSSHSMTCSNSCAMSSVASGPGVTQMSARAFVTDTLVKVVQARPAGERKARFART